MTEARNPRELTWAQVDPVRHPFDAEEARELVWRVAPEPPPPRPAAAEMDRFAAWSEQLGEPWQREMTDALVARYGPWAAGWRWSVGEGGDGGGIVQAWCCPGQSIGTREETFGKVADALVEWRYRLDDLAGRFERFRPAEGDSPHEQRECFERAVARLVLVVSDRTFHESDWYGMCETVLGWYLSAAGVPVERHADLVGAAIGGRFSSWVEPQPAVVEEIATRLATGIAEERRA